jgi:hypothetical protein
MDMRIATDQPEWRKSHLRSIQINLGSAPYFDRVFPVVRDWLDSDKVYLADLTISGICLVADMLGFKPRFVRASQLSPEGSKTSLLVNLCRQVGAEQYYSSVGARVYMDADLGMFAEAGIQVSYQTWQHPTYPQRGGAFISHLSVLDALMNVGPEGVRALVGV